jgi:hypothetical protein
MIRLAIADWRLGQATGAIDNAPDNPQSSMQSPIANRQSSIGNHQSVNRQSPIGNRQ